MTMAWRLSSVLTSLCATLVWARQMPFTDYLAEKIGDNATVLSDIDENGEIPSYVLEEGEDNATAVAVADSNDMLLDQSISADVLKADGMHTESKDEMQRVIVPLRRELVPIRRQGKIVTYKTSYSGELSIGVPAQPFRAVFDTGSGHIIIPTVGCQSEACLIHKQYNLADSETGTAIHSNGSAIKLGELTEEVTIGFGTGVVKSQFVNDYVCLGPVVGETVGDDAVTNQSHLRRGCLEMRVLMAIEMSDKPFASFLFDGIVGLGLSMLAVSDEFSMFEMLSRSGQLAAAQFGFFLTEADHGEQSEISFGGPDPRRILEPVQWTPVIRPEEGHWLVALKAVRVNGEVLDICKDGSCRAVVDTGTTHIGVPVAAKELLHNMLVRDAGDYLDCRLAESYTLELELDSVNLTLRPINYMRRMPLRHGVDVGNNVVSDDLANAAGNITKNVTEVDVNATNVSRYCGPRLMATKMPAPLGPNLWILGEPLVQKYYTVYDWSKLRVGFSLANSHRNTKFKPEGKGVLPEEVASEGHLLCQNSFLHDV